MADVAGVLAFETFLFAANGFGGRLGVAEAGVVGVSEEVLQLRLREARLVFVENPDLGGGVPRRHEAMTNPDRFKIVAEDSGIDRFWDGSGLSQRCVLVLRRSRDPRVGWELPTCSLRLS